MTEPARSTEPCLICQPAARAALERDEAQPGIGASKVRCRECVHPVPDEHCADNPDVRWCPVYGQYRYVRLERQCERFEPTAGDRELDELSLLRLERGANH